jgi:transcriptional regulator with XRE-family HTH domain
VELLSAVRNSAVMTTREQFAKNLREHRVRVGISQEALAHACDLHRTEISLLERSKRSPRLETIVILAKGLKLKSACELLEGVR